MASVTQLWSFQLLLRGQKPGNAFRTQKDTSLLASDSHEVSCSEQYPREFEPVGVRVYNGDASCSVNFALLLVMQLLLLYERQQTNMWHTQMFKGLQSPVKKKNKIVLIKKNTPGS